MGKTLPVHFRVVKHGVQTGEVFAVILTGSVTTGEDGSPMLPTFTEAHGKGNAAKTWVRHHTRPARPEEYNRLSGIIKKHFGPHDAYPKLTDRFRL